MAAVLAVALWFVGGVCAARVVPRTRSFASVLHAWVVNVALPGLVLAKLPLLGWNGDAIIPVAAAWGTVLVGAACVTWMGRRLSWTPQVNGTMLLLVPLGNTSFLGVPVVESLLGVDHLPSALAFDQLGTFLALATYGSWVVARSGGGAMSAGSVLRRVATFPPFIALVVSMVLRVAPAPTVVNDLFGTLGRSVAPVAMLATGLRLASLRPRERASLVATGLALKMLVLPGVVALAMLVVGDVSAVAWQSALLEAAMPPMVTAGIVAARAGMDEELATSLVATGTVLALVMATAVSFVS